MIGLSKIKRYKRVESKPLELLEQPRAYIGTKKYLQEQPEGYGKRGK